MQVRHAGATRRTVVFFQIEEGKLQVWVYKKGLEQGESMGQGTTSDADWACRGDEKNVHFCKIEKGSYRFGYTRQGLSKGIPLAQARLQMQIGHAGAMRTTFTFSDKRRRVTGLGITEKY